MSRPLVIVLCAVTLLLGGCGVFFAWTAGAFTDDGRFPGRVDACSLVDDQTLVALLNKPVKDERASHPPRSLLGWGGDMSATCEWDATASGGPFSSLQILAERRVDDPPDRSAPERAHQTFRKARPTTAADVAGLGDEAHTQVERGGVVIGIWSNINADTHVRFRSSNVVIDISARNAVNDQKRLNEVLLAAARKIAANLEALAN